MCLWCNFNNETFPNEALLGYDLLKRRIWEVSKRFDVFLNRR